MLRDVGLLKRELMGKDRTILSLQKQVMDVLSINNVLLAENKSLRETNVSTIQSNKLLVEMIHHDAKKGN